MRQSCLDLIQRELAQIEQEKSRLHTTLADIEQRLEAQQATIDQLDSLTAYCQREAQNLETFGFDEKRLALEALDVTVVANGRQWRIKGAFQWKIMRVYCPQPQNIVGACRGYFQSPFDVLLPLDVSKILMIDRLLLKQRLDIAPRLRNRLRPIKKPMACARVATPKTGTSSITAASAAFSAGTIMPSSPAWRNASAMGMAPAMALTRPSRDSSPTTRYL